jgi:hypothetical protein
MQVNLLSDDVFMLIYSDSEDRREYQTSMARTWDKVQPANTLF